MCRPASSRNDARSAASETAPPPTDSADSQAGSGAAAALIPGIGPVVSGGLLAAALAGGATGAVAGAAADQEFREGRTIMTVRADDRYGDPSDIVRRRSGFDYETRADRPTVVGEKKLSDTDVKR